MNNNETSQGNKLLPNYLNNKKGRWFRVLYFGLVALMILALIVVGLSIWNNIYIKSRSTLAPHANSLTEVMSRFLTFEEDVLLSTAEQFDITRAHSVKAKETLDNLIRVSKYIKAVAVLDSNSNVLISHGHYEGEDWGRLFLNESAALSAVGLPFRMSSFGEHFLPLRVPIYNHNNAVVGYLVAAYQIIGPDGVWNKSAVSINNAKVTFSNDKGFIYASYPEKKSFLQSFGTARIAPNLIPELALINENAVGLGSVSTANGDVFFSAKKVPDFNGYVVVSIQYSNLWDVWFTRMQFATLIILAVALLGLLVLRISIRRAYVFEEEKHIAQHSVSKLSRAIEASPSSVIVTNSRWVTEYANRKLLDGAGQIIEIAPNTILVDSKPHDLLKPDLEKILVALRLGENWYCERCDESQQQWFSFSISKMSVENDLDESYIIITQNITERKKVEARLYKQAYFDSLTGLPNRRNSSLLLQKELLQSRKDNGQVALIYLDLDNFKSVNDRFGHAIGDQLLQAVARRLGQVMYQKGTACHMSGDEFLAFMPYEKKDEIVDLINNIIALITTPITLEGKELYVTVSMGISCFPNDCSDEVTMLKNADIALYYSKDSGRNCYSFFDEELEERSKRKLELEAEIRTALDNDELYMVYQTKNKISDYTVCSFEALMRWRSPKLGFVGPDEFIMAAESIGVIEKMGEFAIYQACRDLKKFQLESDQPLTMAVNLSMRQLANDDIVGIVENVLLSEEIDPARLELEITETMLAENFDVVLPILDKLLALGIALSIDDFGTGYSSLNYLTRFPVSTLKVDRCFIMDMVNKPKDAALTESVIQMAHRLGLKVVAEGIEDHDQIELLQKFSCDIGQGYFYTKPIKADDIVELLRDQPRIIAKIHSDATGEKESIQVLEKSLGLELE
ncbi:MAG: EAL domain-containing protein [Oceanospirillaceae bacterium]|nr:EAL domain-containing protein [Oceanospirillaceae bacterium]